MKRRVGRAAAGDFQMALLGKGAVAMWWDMAPDQRQEFENWHSHEHFPERMRIPGFLRGSRWASADGGEGFFVMYELDDYATLTSAHYLARLNQPSPWSTKMMPHHRNMVRSQCRVLDSVGGALARFALTLRLSPAEGKEDALRDFLGEQARKVSSEAGITAAHLLHTQTPAGAQTVEQKIRGGDAAADWIYVVCGYEQEALDSLRAGDLSAESLSRSGAAGEVRTGFYALSHTNTAGDVA